nr:isoform 2 of mdis1-interacting receptor like kinase 2 [Quercus suber]
MTSLSNKPLFNQFLSSLLFFHLLLIILLFVSSSTASVSSLSSPFVHSNSKVKIAEETKEAMALLNWKTSLHNKSQSLLSSWVGTTPCNWVEINCDHSGSVTHLNLSGYGLRGTLHNLNFQSFPNLLSLNLSNNSLSGIINSNISHLSKLSLLDLSGNQFTGRIPSEIGNLTSLHVIDLSANRMTGLIPQDLGALSSLSGSLEKILNNDELALEFDWVKRVNVVKARIMSSDASYWTSFVGTIGYTAPEHAYTMEVKSVTFTALEWSLWK